MVDARQLDTLRNIKRQLALLLEAYDRDEYETAKFRALSYGFQVLTQVARAEAEYDLGKELEEIRDIIDRVSRRGRGYETSED